MAFTEWIAFQHIEPSGWDMDNWRTGMLAAAVVNAVYTTIPVPRGSSHPKPLKPADFYPPIRNTQQPDLTPKQTAHIRKKNGKRRNSNR